jgi:hypothetical protein
MSALGQKQPLVSIQILSSEWLLSGYSGHSPLRKLGDMSGCFRPEADVVRLMPGHFYVLSRLATFALVPDSPHVIIINAVFN